MRILAALFLPRKDKRSRGTVPSSSFASLRRRSNRSRSFTYYLPLLLFFLSLFVANGHHGADANSAAGWIQPCCQADKDGKNQGKAGQPDGDNGDIGGRAAHAPLDIIRADAVNNLRGSVTEAKAEDSPEKTDQQRLPSGRWSGYRQRKRR